MANSVTFNVHNVTPVDPTNIAKLKSASLYTFAENRLGLKDSTKKIESISSNIRLYGSDCHGLFKAIHDAYDNHIPIELTPDDIKLMILQGLAIHINENAEYFRKSLVNHEGKKKITVRRDDFIKGNLHNPWEQVFGEFANKIKEDIKDPELVNMIQSPLTTSTDITIASFNIALMEMCQKFYSYGFVTCCGIPSITIKGSPNDWLSIMELVNYIEKFELGWWTSKLKPVIKEFIDASNNNINKEFWGNILKINGGSGGPFYDGWLINFFPYMVSGNKFRKSNFSRCTFNFPSGLSSAPVEWLYLDTKFNMTFTAGFFGYSIEDGVIKPTISWAIHESHNPDTNEDKNNDSNTGLPYSTKILSAYANGEYYDPAWKHYDVVGAVVNCDVCKEKNIESCIGFLETDICMKCVAIMNTKMNTKM